MAFGTSAGDVYLEGHYRNAPAFGREMSVAVNRPATKAGEEASKHFGRKFAAGLAISAGVIGVGLFKATKLAARGILATTAAASALNEQVNKSNAIFGKSAKEIQRWSRGAANGFGLSRTEALANAAAFGDMFQQLKIGEKPATTMSKRMVELAADLASFNDADITQVLEAQQAAFRGEYDSLQRFIPAINAARVEQVALAQTHKKSAKELTAAEKAQATYTIIMKDSVRAHGDYARTLKGSVANQNRQAKAQWEDLKVTLGKGFLPAQLAVTRAFTEKLAPALKIFATELMPGVQATATAVATSFSNSIPPAGELADTAKRLGERLEVLGPDLGAKIGAGLGKLFDLVKQLGPELRNADVHASDLGGTLTVSGALFGFVADHAEFLAKNIGLVVAAYVALKGIQAAAQAAQVAQVALLPAQIAGNFTLARSNRALAASLGERGAATIAVTGAQAGLTASTTTATAATTAAAAGQGAVAASLAPLIARLAALSLGLYGIVTAYRVVRTESQHLTRDTHTTSDAVKRYGLTAGIAVANTKRLRDQLSPTEIEQRRLAAAMHSGADAARAEKQAIDALRGALVSEEAAELDVRQAKLNVASAQQRLTGLVKDGRKGSLDYKQAQIDLRRAQVDLKGRTADYRDAQLKANAATGGAMRAAQAARPKYTDFGEAARVAGIKARTMGAKAREGILSIPSKTVTIKATFGFKTPPGVSMHDIVGATGGYVTGRAIVPRRFHRGGFLDGPGTDTSDSIPARLSKGEYVVRARAVRAVGRDTLDHINAQGFAVGGPVLNNKITGAGPMLRAANRFEGVIDRSMRRMATKWDKVADQFGGGILGGGSGPGGWRWQMATLRRVFPGLALISGFRPGAITATGNRSYHGFGRAVDIPPRMDVFNWIRGTYGKRTRELIFSPAGGRQVHNGSPHYYTGVTRANHWDHVHWAYDKGGWLMPGTTVATNNTGHPERVVPPGPMVARLDSRDVRAVADAVVRGLQSTPLQVHVSPNALRTGVKTAQRSAGVPAARQIR